ncbi:MAG TPA: copper chaperone [Acidimicrobiia bacterium]|jgi:copper chaperone|nr:copper chaperone [Acidimicrobiia bacterium]HIL45905.1 copper chaperone [Acidimicrobiia bacterium]
MSAFHVPEISCGHCTSAIEQEVGQVPGVDKVVADVDTKMVEVSGTASDETIVAAIAEAGFAVAF